jgi:hypothetical protein
MHPFERRRTGPPPGVKPSLQVHLKEGWSLSPRKRSFVTSGGGEHKLKGILPTGARVIPMVTLLDKVGPDWLSDEQRFLSRIVQVVFPEGTDTAEYADSLRQLDPVEEVRTPPQIGLP